MSPPQPLDVFGCPLQGVQLIEASAGTGKTWTLCGLYLRLLLQRQLPVQQILVVTFTNAATAELSERIRERIAQVLAHLQAGRADARAAAGTDPFVASLLASLPHDAAQPAVLQQRLTRALQEFDEAAIFTIHGFCQRALADTPFAAGLPLVQQLLQDDRELLAEVARDFWRRQVAGGALQPELAAHVGQRDTPEGLARVLRRHMGKPLSQVLWPHDTEEVRTVDVSAVHAAYDEARRLWRAQRATVLACVAAALPGLHRTSYSEDKVAEAAAEWDELLRADRPAGCPVPGKRAPLLTRSRLKAKKGHAPCEEHPFFAAAERLLEACTAAGNDLERARMALLRRFVETAPDELRQRKRDKRVLAFDDLLFNLRQRLNAAGGDDLAAALRQRYPAALIDEFQDTDPLQFSIFERVYARRPDTLLFLVGDPKQAIYSFRNADLHTYLRARHIAGAEYTLDANQRSTPALLAALNALFGANPAAFMLPGLAYHPVVAGSKSRKPLVDASLPRAPLQLWSLPDGADGRPCAKAAARAAATRSCAGEIARLLAAGQRGEVTHDGKPLAAGDIAVLVRSHGEGSEMRAALGALGVGSVELAQVSVLRSPDAEELERILAAILEPARERLLRAALATELLGFDAVALDAADDAAMLDHLGRFRDYLGTWTDHGVASMLRELFTREGVHRRMLPRPDGERRLTNLRHLGECLHEASREHPGPKALLRWLRRQRQDEACSEATQLRLESDRNLVQIVTIHKSKGLEYPIVFCPYLWNGHEHAAGSGACEYHADDGAPVIDYREPDEDTRQTIRLEKDAERLRLAYVALTRAVHRCYVVIGAYTTGPGSTSECALNPLNWLVAGSGMAPRQWRQSKTSAETVRLAWQTLANRQDSTISLQPLPAPATAALPLVLPAAASLSALAPPARIHPGWRIASYSSLAHGFHAEAAAADRDVRVDGGSEPTAAPAVAADDILHFPRGARAGECLHAMFEQVEFTDPARWPQAVAAALRTHAPSASVDADALAAMALRMLGDVLATPLHGGLRLREVPAGKRRVELEFALAAPRMSPLALGTTLLRHGYAAPRLSGQPLQGYLRGFIDLVFEHEGRFHIVDWKSNHLGWTPRDYAPDRVGAAMVAQGYPLQYLLYTVAVHRWLARRLRGYDYDTHFGGVHYLFVRGVRPQWRPDGGQAGVFHDKPSRELVQALDALLGGDERRAA